MCKLCTNDPKEREEALKEHLQLAQEFREMARYYEDLGNGEVEPHQEDDRTKRLSYIAAALAAELVTQWW